MILKVNNGDGYVLFEGNIIRKLTKIPDGYPINYVMKKPALCKFDIFYIQNYDKHVTTVVTNRSYKIINSEGVDIK